MTALAGLLWIASIAVMALAAAYGYERVARRNDRQNLSAPGRLINVGSHRLHLFCQGSFGPTVVIEQGAGETSRLWWSIQEKVAAFARVCTYDRAGYSWSEPVSGSRSVSERAQDLHRLLIGAAIPGPFILVAHSYGGLIVRQFAVMYRAETAGLVLVDTTDEFALSRPRVQKFYGRMGFFMKALAVAAQFGVPRLLRHIPSLRDAIFFVRSDEYAAAADDLASLKHLDCSAGAPGTLGDLPVVVITHGLPFPGPFAVLEEGWMESQYRLVALSSKAILVMAKNSNHMIHLDEPEVVVQAIRQMHASRVVSV